MSDLAELKNKITGGMSAKLEGSLLQGGKRRKGRKSSKKSKKSKRKSRKSRRKSSRRRRR